ncbi:hypothetical protein CR62_01155 [Serratia grimesii]|uniref:Uncharacterized protein n=1 Tax=Serratia grimesii TaxID=82995 RepID=A0ABR4UFF3_9GAMM|nr:hypothetical protein CR62_01155 [Serratia grimesii]
MGILQQSAHIQHSVMILMPHDGKCEQPGAIIQKVMSHFLKQVLISVADYRVIYLDTFDEKSISEVITPILLSVLFANVIKVTINAQNG